MEGDKEKVGVELIQRTGGLQLGFIPDLQHFYFSSPCNFSCLKTVFHKYISQNHVCNKSIILLGIRIFFLNEAENRLQKKADLIILE